jgi:hypothetical protein
MPGLGAPPLAWYAFHTGSVVLYPLKAIAAEWKSAENGPGGAKKVAKVKRRITAYVTQSGRLHLTKINKIYVETLQCHENQFA